MNASVHATSPHPNFRTEVDFELPRGDLEDAATLHRRGAPDVLPDGLAH
jgi:hypothetical protein